MVMSPQTLAAVKKRADEFKKECDDWLDEATASWRRQQVAIIKSDSDLATLAGANARAALSMARIAHEKYRRSMISIGEAPHTCVPRFAGRGRCVCDYCGVQMPVHV